MKSFLYLVVISIATIPTAVFAQNYLVGIPGVEQGANGNFDGYIQAVYVMFISIAALLAVVKIIIAGLKYMFTDIVPQKTNAKKDIQGALFGLLIVISAVLILTVINPELTGFNFQQDQLAAPTLTNTNLSPSEILLAQIERDITSSNIDRQCADSRCIPESIACEAGDLFEGDNSRGRFEPFTRDGQDYYNCSLVISSENQQILDDAERNSAFEEQIPIVRERCNNNGGLLWNDTTNRCYMAELTPTPATLESILNSNNPDARIDYVRGALVRRGYSFNDPNLHQTIVDNGDMFRVCDLMSTAPNVDRVRYSLLSLDSCSYLSKTLTQTEAPEPFQISENLWPD